MTKTKTVQWKLLIDGPHYILLYYHRISFPCNEKTVVGTYYWLSLILVISSYWCSVLSSIWDLYQCLALTIGSILGLGLILLISSYYWLSLTRGWVLY